MPKRMLIDASHREETRVVVLDGQKVEEFDFEAASKRPLKGNIYLAKVTRVEPSLQAAFVEYGGNRQGFLAFSEIHPDYYQIPVADRLALLAEQEAEARRRGDDDFEAVETASPSSEPNLSTDMDEDEEIVGEADEATSAEAPSGSDAEVDGSTFDEIDSADNPAEHHSEVNGTAETTSDDGEDTDENDGIDVAEGAGDTEPAAQPAQALRAPRPRQRSPRRRHYKIQEVIKRRQIILVQVVKEERGNKGAALTTYLSLAGRYCVLMPNTPRGGGISRKITNAADRKRLKSAAAALELPEGMGLIIRTAGENRTKLEIKRDYEYLLRMWDTIRELTLQSNAPACVYEEGDLIKRAIRDLYNKDVAEIQVEGDDGYRNAKDFMRMLMPSHAKNVKQYKEPVPLFQRMHIEAQLDAMFSNTVTLKSGGYIVINQTEALVAIDVNSGRATREHNIEDTAYKTNLEAADEIARQLRLRDLAGLIVIDFIDMEDGRNDRSVEKRLRDAVKNDRARIQIGKISQFGLLEMSRQRLRAGVIAGSTIPCPHCEGQGIVRSVESTALRVLRGLEEEAQRQRAAAVTVRVAPDVAVYTLNQKRKEIARIESDYAISVIFAPDDEQTAGNFEIDRTQARAPEDRVKVAVTVEAVLPEPEIIDAEVPAELSEDVEETDENEEVRHVAPPGDGENSGRRRRRRRRRGGRGRERDETQQFSEEAPLPGQQVQPKSQQRPVEDRYSFESADEIDTTPGVYDAAAQNSDVSTDDVHESGVESRADGEGRRRKRRRRGRRGGGRREDGGFDQPQLEGVPVDDSVRDLDAAEESVLDTPKTTLEVAPVAPNAPSEPMWSLTSAERAAPAKEEVKVSAEIPKPEPIKAPAKEPAGPVPSSAETAAPPQPSRKGWWQRTFRPE